MEVVLTQGADTRREKVELPASALLLAPPQQMITLESGTFAVERRPEDDAMSAVFLQVQLSSKQFQLLRATQTFGLHKAEALPAQTSVRLDLKLKEQAFFRINGRLRNVTDIEDILQTRGPEDFPYFLQLAHYDLQLLSQVDKQYSFPPPAV